MRPTDARFPFVCVALDCEMVGVGPSGVESTLARVSIVNYHGHTVLDRFVRPREKVTDYRTWVSGVREEDLRNGEFPRLARRAATSAKRAPPLVPPAPSFQEVQKEVAELLKDRILVGHALSNDTNVSSEPLICAKAGQNRVSHLTCRTRRQGSAALAPVDDDARHVKLLSPARSDKNQEAFAAHSCKVDPRGGYPVRRALLGAWSRPSHSARSPSSHASFDSHRSVTRSLSSSSYGR